MNTRRFAFNHRAMFWAAFLLVTGYSSAQTSPPQLNTLYNFTGIGGDGSDPSAGVAIGKNGMLYGTTTQGGTGNPGEGTVFELTPPIAPGDGWTETVLYRFLNSPHASAPEASVIITDAGLLGIAQGGGGVVYGLTPPAAGGAAWTYRSLYSFLNSHDGRGPVGNLTMGSNGILYGTTYSGLQAGGFGTVFALIPPASAGASWTKKVIHNFKGGDDGSFPMAGLVMGKDQALYGTASGGGTGFACGGCGVVFKLMPPTIPDGSWTESVLYSFQGFNDGAQPRTAPTLDRSGALYGTTFYGGPANAGTVFKLAPPASPSGAWTEQVLYSFQAPSSGLSSVPNSVVLADDGVIYGTAQNDGDNGTIFKLTPPTSAGGVWTETVLYRFTGSFDGAFPSALAPGPDGILFGTTSNGGTGCCGTVFAFVP